VKKPQEVGRWGVTQRRKAECTEKSPSKVTSEADENMSLTEKHPRKKDADKGLRRTPSKQTPEKEEREEFCGEA